MPADLPAPIARINDITPAARSAWFALLGYLAFVAVTLLSVRDADFLISTQTIHLPLVNIEVPTRLFFFLAPVLAAALYFNLHLYLNKLWEAFEDAGDDAAAEAPLADAVHPWLVNDLALTLKIGVTPKDAVRAPYRTWAAIASVWLAQPAVLVWFWWRSWQTHDWFLSSAIFAMLFVSACVGLSSWLQAQHRLAGWDLDRLKRPLRRLGGVFALFGLVASLVLTGTAARLASWLPVPLSAEAAVEGSALETALLQTPAPDIDRTELAALPSSIPDAATDKAAFRASWCPKDLVDLCGTLPDRDDIATRRNLIARTAYCAAQHWSSRNCTRVFDRLDAAFGLAWQSARKARLDSLPQFSLAGQDLHGASAVGIKLVGARLDGIDLGSALLPYSALEGAVLIKADLRATKLFYSSLDRTDLTGADLRGADLGSASLEGAVLVNVDARKARLANAWLVDADLRGADLRDADLHGAKLHRATLDGALLAGADLSGATGLTPGQLQGTFGDSQTRLPRDRWPGAPQTLYVWSCLERAALPPPVAALLPPPGVPATTPRQQALQAHLCQPEQMRLPTGLQYPPAEQPSLAPAAQPGAVRTATR